MSILHQYLTAMAEMMRDYQCRLGSRQQRESLEAFVLRRGVAYAPAALTPEERLVVAAARRRANRRGRSVTTPKLCFDNAQRLVMADITGALDYVEGYGIKLTLGVPMLHGWVAISGKVIDPTWGDVWGEYTACEYLGVTFPTASVVERRARKGDDGCSMIDDWRGGWPLLALTTPAPGAPPQDSTGAASNPVAPATIPR